MNQGSQNLWTVDDVLQVKTITEVTVSPDGTQSAYVLRTLAESRTEYRYKLWTVSLTQPSAPTQLTRGNTQDIMPKYSPCGRYLAFLRRGATQSENPKQNDDAPESDVCLFLLPLVGGEPFCVTEDIGTVYDYAFSPDGASIYVITDESESKYRRLQKRRRDKQKQDVTHEERLKTPKRICQIDVDSKAVHTLYSRDYGLQELTVSPDGSRIAFVTCYTGLNNDWHESDIWLLEDPKVHSGHLVDVETTGQDSTLSMDVPAPASSSIPSIDAEAAAIHPDRPKWTARAFVTRTGSCTQPRFSPSGDTLSFIAPKRGVLEHSQSDVWLVSVSDNTCLVNLSEAADSAFDVQNVEWMDSQTLVAQVEKGLYAPLITLSADVELLVADPVQVTWTYASESHLVVRPWALHPGTNQIVFAAEDANTPMELFRAFPSSEQVDVLTHYADAWKDKFRARIEPFTWTSFDGTEIEGVLALPHPDVHPSDQPVPLIVTIHGGPAWHTTVTFSQGTNWHWLTSQGYAVFAPNYRGGIAYGDEYVAANQRDLGGGDYRDILAGVDAVVATGKIDGNRLGVMGGSYGGYMTNWIIGHDHRFQAAVSEFGIWSLFTDFGCSSMRNWETMYLGTYWENESLYFERSPSRYVHTVQTPVLIVHGDADDNTFISNSKEMYNALLEAGKTVEFVHYPREGHGIREPQHKKDELSKILKWFDTYLRPDRSPASIPFGSEAHMHDRSFGIVSVETTSAYRGYGDEFQRVIAVTVRYQALRGTPSRELEQPPVVSHTTRSSGWEMVLGDAEKSHVRLASTSAEAHQRKSVLAEHEIPLLGVLLDGGATLVEGNAKVHINGSGQMTLLFSEEALAWMSLPHWVLQIGTGAQTVQFALQ